MLKKVLVSLLIAVTLLASVIGLLPQGNVAQADFDVTEAVVTVTTPIYPAQSYEFDAGGFSSGEQVEYLLGNVRLARDVADEDGVSTSTVKIPTDMVYGVYTVTARNANSTSVATDSVTLNPGLVVSKSSGSVGQSVQVQGFAFTAVETYAITFTNEVDEEAPGCVDPDATVSETLTTGRSTRLGSFNKTVTVPDVEAGTYNIVAQGITSSVCAVY